MTFINNEFDVTLSPYNHGLVLQQNAALRAKKPMSFNEATAVNHIYQNNGLICQQKMCSSLMGCDTGIFLCTNHPEWPKVLQFCGQNHTGGFAYDGTWVQILPGNNQQQLLTTAQQSTGYCKLPTATNTFQGMYTDSANVQLGVARKC